MDSNDSRRSKIDLKRQTLTLEVKSQLTEEKINKKINLTNKSENKIDFQILDQESQTENKEFKQMTLVSNSYNDLEKQ